MKIAFRVDSGKHIGMGHIMRCLTLADELAEMGNEIFFICREHLGANYGLVSRKHKLFLLGTGIHSELDEVDKNNYSKWLGVSQEEDLTATNEIISREGIDCLIIDHYSLDILFEKRLQVRRILVIDDLMSRSHYCDLLLDQNLSAEMDKYKTLVNENCKLLLGPQYALLKKEFAEFRKPRDGEIKSILVFFGTSDLRRDTLKFFEALNEEELHTFVFHILISCEHQDYKTFVQLHRNITNLKLHNFVENMAFFMSQFDFCIGAAGATSWERVCSGLPSASVGVLENQQPIGIALRDNGLSYYMGDSSKIRKEDWRQFLDGEFKNSEGHSKMSIKCLAMMDGQGTTRVARQIMELAC